MAATLFVFTLTIGLNAVIVFSDPKHVPISYAELKTDVSTRYAELQKLDSRI
jgi:hypothetical protein